MEQGFVKREPKGRTFVLTTTTKFIEYFGKDLGTKRSLAVAQTSSDSKSGVAQKVNEVMEQAIEEVQE